MLEDPCLKSPEFGEHESRPEEPTDEHIPLDLVTPVGGSTWEPTREQETSFGGESQRTKLIKDYMCTFQILGGWQGRRTLRVPPSLPPPLIFKPKFKIFVTLPS